MTTIKNKAIMASAGSGKTFQLAHRYIQLMAHGEDPERIIALTFSRKAAGEIFDSIVQYLHQAAASKKKAADTAREIGLETLTVADFNRLLRTLLQKMNRLQVGTLDSFIVSILKTFPAELGIPLHFTLGDNGGAEARQVQQEVLRRIFNARYVDPEAQQRFHQAFKQATFGREEKGLMKNLDQFISDHREAYQQLPDGGRWGSPEVIWPGGSPWLTEISGIEDLAQALLRSLADAEVDPKIMARWEIFTEAVTRFGPGSPWGTEIKYLFEKLMPLADQLEKGATLKVDRKNQELDAEQGLAARALLQRVMWAEITGRLEETQGIFQVLDQYEAQYQQMIQRQGFLTFTDAACLLSPGNPYSRSAGLTSRVDDADRMFIDYRLDSRLDHWLLDEFQDTSNIQWNALENLADEVFQDDSGRRTFFNVGDVKQAIYGWRGGNPRLFEKVEKRYEEKLVREDLSDSYRSCQPIIDAVNRVFGALDDTDLPQEALAHWQDIWETHRPAGGMVPEHGCVEVLETEREGKPTDHTAARYEAAAQRLNILRPLDKGMTVAFLLRSNKAVSEMAEVLREACPGMPVVQEGKAEITDNPLVSVLQSLVQFAFHPGDTYAWRHLHMSPLSKPLSTRGAGRTALRLLAHIQQDGFQVFLQHWGRELDRLCPLDAFGRMRLNDLLDAAAEFDQTGSRDGGAFLEFLEDYQVHDAGSDQAIRVMTMHQAKGLGFDVVFLPDLEGKQGLASSGELGLCVQGAGEEDGPDWVLRMPRRSICQYDHVLQQVMQEADADHCFDSLCLMYVALTRAKRAMYMVITAPPGKSSTVRPSSLVREKLNGGTAAPPPGARVHYLGGDAKWLEKTATPAAKSPRTRTPWPKQYPEQRSTRRRLRRGIPSATAEGIKSAENLFGAHSTESASFGTALHDLFEQVEFIDEMDPEDIIKAWTDKGRFDSALAERAVEQFRQTLTDAACRKVLSRSSKHEQVWREAAFEAIVDERWYTGVFDRVVIEVDESGRALSAVILDYKSNQIRDEDHLSETAAQYADQLGLYRKALSAMLNLPAEKIGLQLLFTHPRRVVEIG